jgi:hypothetical protein
MWRRMIVMERRDKLLGVGVDMDTEWSEGLFFVIPGLGLRFSFFLLSA